MKACCLAVLFVAVTSCLGAEPLSLDKCGDGNSYRVAPYLDVVVALQSLSQEAAIAQLEKWADTRKQDEQVIFLCRMLFEAKEGSEFRRPALGGPQFYGGMGFGDWPLEPIALVDNIPLKIVFGYVLAGAPPDGQRYLKYCRQEARWTSRRYKKASKAEIEQALQKLLQSTKWKTPLDAWQLGLIREQI